ncbi:MAG: CxxC-x17-CxxC domain-containing protein [Candidatus Bathyarchaeia archaeon]
MSQRNVYEAKCTICNQIAIVPFKPTPGKPVYCKTCFAKRLTNQPIRTNTSNNFEPKQAWARRRK